MANSDQAVLHVLENEGGYSNDPADPGQETFRGISRNHFPNWEGWPHIDATKAFSDFRTRIMGDPTLLDMVKGFYLTTFWMAPLYDQIDSQAIANKLLDMGVNMGTETAVRLLQRGLGYLCAGPVVDDGKFGARTLDFVNGADEPKLLNELRARSAKKYHDIAVADVNSERFMLGWLRRAALPL